MKRGCVIERKFNIDLFKKVLSKQLEFEFIVDNPIRGGNGNYKNGKPILLMDHLLAYIAGTRFNAFVSENIDKKKTLIDIKVDRKKTPKGSPSPIPRRICQLIIYALHKCQRQTETQEELREYLFNLRGEWSVGNNKELGFSLPSVPQSSFETGGTFTWGSKLKSYLLDVLKKKYLDAYPEKNFDKKHNLNSIIEEFDNPRGFHLTPGDVNRYTMLK